MIDPKMIIKEAAAALNISEKQAISRLEELKLPFYKVSNLSYFGHTSAIDFFGFRHKPQAIAFQIVKGGTGKTSIASAFAVRANLYGLRVLCIDLDQQGNLTHTFGVNAENYPVMIDILAEGYTYEQGIIKVSSGLYVLASRIENALIDDVIKLKKLPLDLVYRGHFADLKKQFDLIVIDCPPNLGHSVAAITLAVDQVVAPVVPENFALSGLKITCNAIKELQHNYFTNINFKILVNKYDARTILSQDALRLLTQHPVYSEHLLHNYVRTSQEFPNVVAKSKTIFDQIKPSIAKVDIDNITKEILNLGSFAKVDKPHNKTNNSMIKNLSVTELEETIVL